MAEWLAGWASGLAGWASGLAGWPRGGERMDESTYGRTNERKISPFYRTSSPMGAAAQKGCVLKFPMLCVCWSGFFPIFVSLTACVEMFRRHLDYTENHTKSKTHAVLEKQLFRLIYHGTHSKSTFELEVDPIRIMKNSYADLGLTCSISSCCPNWRQFFLFLNSNWTVPGSYLPQPQSHHTVSGSPLPVASFLNQNCSRD